MIKNTDKIKIPKLRFPEFEGEWDRRSLLGFGLDVIDGDRGGNYPNGDDFSPVGYCLFLNAKNVTKAGFTFDQTSFIAKEKDEALRKGKLNRNDLVLTTRGTVGNIAYYDDSINYPNVRINSGMVIIRNKTSKINSQFVYIYFFAPVLVKQMKVIAFGSAQPQLTVKEIHKINLSLPTLPEQEKIASFLSSVDKKIQQLTRKKELLEKYKKGVMQRIFAAGKNSSVKGKGKSVKLNADTDFAPIRFKDEDGKDYPDWEEKRLGEILTIGSGRDYKHLNKGSIPVYGTGGYMLSVDDYLYDGESVCIGRKGTIDNPMFINGKFWTVDTLFYTHSFQSSLPKFIYFVFQMINWKKHNEASGVPSLSKKTIERLKCNIPPVQEQNKIATFLSDIDKKIESIQNQLTKTQTFKKGLLQQMFV